MSYSLTAISLYFNFEMKSTITFLIMRKIKPRDTHHHSVSCNVSSRSHFALYLFYKMISLLAQIVQQALGPTLLSKIPLNVLEGRKCLSPNAVTAA